MRIVGGSHRGRHLLALGGDVVRPTSDRAREALFNILSHGSVAGEGDAVAGGLVLDAFAGTGAFGLEALSRGAAGAVFIERAPDALAVLRQNIAALGEGARAQIVAGDASRPPRASRPCALAFLDPPYGSGLALPALAALDAALWLAPLALVVVEIARRETLGPADRYRIIDERTYGAARLVFLRRCGAPQGEGKDG